MSESAYVIEEVCNGWTVTTGYEPNEEIHVFNTFDDLVLHLKGLFRSEQHWAGAERQEIPEDCTACFYCKTGKDIHISEALISEKVLRHVCRYGLSASEPNKLIEDTKAICIHFRVKGKHE